MKITIYEARKDERAALEAAAREAGAEIKILHTVLNKESLKEAAGSDGISTLGQSRIDEYYLKKMKDMGIMYLSTRTIGYDHIDVEAAHRLGIRVCNSVYSPDGVADFTVMMILMSIRNYKQALWRGQVNDFELNGLLGRDMSSLTIGVMGSGRIGRKVLQNLSGFGCRLLAYDVYENEETKKYAEYVDLETLYRECDVISLHMPLLPSTRHIINSESIGKMKDGVVLINCARGELADIEALITGIETGKIGALGMDTLEGEEGIIHADHRIDILPNRNWFYLHQFRNVIMTQHMAFYTQQAVESMARCGICGICSMAAGEKYISEL